MLVRAQIAGDHGGVRRDRFLSPHRDAGPASRLEARNIRPRGERARRVVHTSRRNRVARRRRRRGSGSSSARLPFLGAEDTARPRLATFGRCGAHWRHERRVVK